ncbi:hypothetical protein [Micrococcus luteus]|uniref:hypothetical protein n=1 Tax=Micrococcus luteus TaxID=1270 RepID=UPI003D333F75
MGGLFGPLGGLDELPCATELSDAPVGSLVLSETAALSGRVYAQSASVMPNREWSVSLGVARPEAAGILYRIASRQVTNARPCVFYSEAALVENILDPAASLMSPLRWTGIIPAGSQVLPSRSKHPRWLESGACSPGGEWAHLSNIPVPHERTVTVSATVSPYVGRQVHFWVDELRMDGSTVRVHKTQTSTLERRLSVVIATTPETVALTIGVSGAVIVVDPQVTLTDQPVPWSPGAGCLNAALTTTPSRQVISAHVAPNDWGRRSAYSWVIREMGDAHMAHTG